MTTYRLWPATNGPGTGTTDTDHYVMGISFKVTSPGMTLTGWYIWVAAASQATTAENCALWVVNGAASGSYVASSSVSSGALTAGQWNFVAATSPIALTSGQEYRAVRSANLAADLNNHYASTGHYWDSGAGSGSIVNGPLTGFAAPGAGTNPEPSGDGQMTFITPATDVTASYPTSEFNQTNYWLDVQVTAPAAGAGALLAAGPP